MLVEWCSLPEKFWSVSSQPGVGVCRRWCLREWRSARGRKEKIDWSWEKDIAIGCNGKGICVIVVPVRIQNQDLVFRRWRDVLTFNGVYSVQESEL
jgi:hypothetical protein